MKAPTNISTLPFEAPKRSMAQNLIYATCAVAVLTVIALLIAENISQRLDTVHKDGVAVGYQLAINLNAPTNETCLAWWFGGDSQRVGKAIAKVKVQ
jgi:hypothetical protein